MTDIGYAFSIVSEQQPEFRNIWCNNIIPYNQNGEYRVEHIMEISDFNRKKESIIRYLENKVNVQGEFFKTSSEDCLAVLNKIGNKRKHIDMTNTKMCMVCYKSYKTITGYRSHMMEQKNCVKSTKQYSCIFCHQLFTSIMNVRKHIHNCEVSIKNQVYVMKLNSSKKHNNSKKNVKN